MFSHDKVLQDEATANGNGEVFHVLSANHVAFQVTGTFSATVNFEATNDFSNWVPLAVSPVAGGPSVTSTTSAGIWATSVPAAGVRARISNYSSGTISVRATATSAGGPSILSHDLVRSNTITTLIDGEVFDDSQTSYNSSAVSVDDYKHFLLYLDVDSTLAPTTIQFIVQFSDDGGTTWYDYKQGLFASLFYEDQDTASGIKECFSGECAGRDFRLRAVATGTDATNKFTVTAKVGFYA